MDIGPRIASYSNGTGCTGLELSHKRSLCWRSKIPLLFPRVFHAANKPLFRINGIQQYTEVPYEVVRVIRVRSDSTVVPCSYHAGGEMRVTVVAVRLVQT